MELQSEGFFVLCGPCALFGLGPLHSWRFAARGALTSSQSSQVGAWLSGLRSLTRAPDFVWSPWGGSVKRLRRAHNALLVAYI